jgi:DNA-binding MarR family transcriptional regulator
VGELADIVLAKQPTVTKMVLRMVDQGLVMRTACTQDKRQAWVSLTLKGKKRVTPLLKKAAIHEKSVLSELGEQQSHELKSILQKLFKAPN